jgi:hypothetical protein
MDLPVTSTRPSAAILSAIVTDATRHYFASRHDRVAPFVNQHFSLRGSLRLHHAAIGWDIARAPFNLAMAVPQAALILATSTAQRLRASRTERALRGRQLLLRTAVARELSWLIHAELLELPFQDRDRSATRDALGEAILADPRLEAALRASMPAIGVHGVDDALRLRLEHALLRYSGSRSAAAEITTSLLSLATGGATLNKLTPGAISLGPALATSLAQHSAIASFSLGSGLGSAWFSLFPVAPSVALVAGTTGGLLALASVAAAFAGVLADPVQRQFGLHQRRLHRMLNALERQALDPLAPGYALHDHYVARLLDLFDVVAVVRRLVPG